MKSHPHADIINLPHHVSKVHPQMSMHQRAAQFSPFAALVGFEDVIDENVRQTDSKRELDEMEKEELDRKLCVIESHLTEKPVVEIEYFIPDASKAGGEYVFRSGVVVRIQPVEKKLILSDGTVIPIDNIAGIAGELFAGEF